MEICRKGEEKYSLLIFPDRLERKESKVGRRNLFVHFDDNSRERGEIDSLESLVSLSRLDCRLLILPDQVFRPDSLSLDVSRETREKLARVTARNLASFSKTILSPVSKNSNGHAIERDLLSNGR